MKVFTPLPKFCFLLCFSLYSTSSSALPIVGLFDHHNARLRSVFERSVAVISDQQADVVVRPVSVVQKPAISIFHKIEQICYALSQGTVAIIGVQEPPMDHHGRSVCDAAEVPYIGVRWDVGNRSDSLMLNMFPDAAAFSKAFTDLIRHWEWTTFVILYEKPEALLKFQDLFKTSPRPEITLRQLDETDHQVIFREIRASGEFRIVLDCSAFKLDAILQQAQQLKLLTRRFQYLLTTLDVHMVDLSAFVYDHAKITSFQLIDFQAKAVHQMTEQTKHGFPRITTEEALIHDAVLLIARTFSDEDLLNIVPYAGQCDDDSSWSQGSQVYNALAHMELDGITGTIMFDSQGSRSSFRLNIVQATSHGPKQVGHWTVNGTIQMGAPIHSSDSLKGRTLHAITVIEKPYVMLKPDHEVRKGNDRYEGFAVDLMDKITARLELNYTLEDKGANFGHGVFSEKLGQWNGLMGELINQRGDVAVGGITITDKREQVVDFTKPFMHVGISILYKRPAKKPPDLFSFLHPFDTKVWIYMIVAFLVVSIVIFILGRFTPYEWYNPHPCNEHADVQENMFTIGNSLWFTVGSLMQQGSDIIPRAVSVRVVAGSWWFFTLIIIASYTANLAAFLAVERTEQPPKGADELSKQSTIKYGCYKGGATFNFFATTKHPIYEKMWKFMNAHPTYGFQSRGEDGVALVKKGNYAYLMELPSLEYEISQNCDLIQLGGLLDSKGYGLATPANSPYRDMISKEILRMQENSELQVLKDKWWRGKGAICDPPNANQSLDLGLENVGGVFVVLLAGLGIALLCAIMEFIWNVRKIARNNGMPFWQQFKESFVQALLLRSNQKYNDRRRRRPIFCFN